MYPHMRVKLGHFIETFIAHVTDMVPDTAMFFHMLTQSGMTSKRFVAFRTLERLFTSMETEMDL